MTNTRGSQNTNIALVVSPPMFSVVISTYNRASLLKRAIHSLISQTENDWEAIIVDDGSTDDTYTQILSYLEARHSIKYFWKHHSGAVSSRNYGIRASGGRFVTFLDSDDEYRPKHLEVRKKFLLKNPAVKFLYGGAKILGSQFVPDKNDPLSSINLKDCVIGGTFVIAREVLLSLNGFREIVLGSDSDLFDRVMENNIKMAEFKLPTYIYHHENQESITNKLYKKVKDHSS